MTLDVAHRMLVTFKFNGLQSLHSFLPPRLNFERINAFISLDLKFAFKFPLHHKICLVHPHGLTKCITVFAFILFP